MTTNNLTESTLEHGHIQHALPAQIDGLLERMLGVWLPLNPFETELRLLIDGQRWPGAMAARHDWSHVRRRSRHVDAPRQRRHRAALEQIANRERGTALRLNARD